MTEKEQKIISIIKQAKANIECEEDIKISDDIVEKIFLEKAGENCFLSDNNEIVFAKRKIINGNI